jgi:hypothetical protein
MEESLYPLDIKKPNIAALANTFLEIFARTYGIGVHVTRSEFNQAITQEDRDNSSDIRKLKAHEFGVFFEQFRCFSIKEQYVVRTFDGYEDEWIEYRGGSESRCKNCFFYTHCSIAAGEVDLIDDTLSDVNPQKLNAKTLEPDYIYNSLFYTYFPEKITIASPKILNSWLENEDYAERAYRLLHTTYSISNLSLQDFIEKLGLSISRTSLNRKFKSYGLEMKPIGMPNPTHTFCDVVKWRKDYLAGLSVNEIARKYKIDTKDPMSYIHSYFDKYKPTMRDTTREERIVVNNKNSQYYDWLHQIYMNWDGTIAGFEEQYDVNWNSMIAYYYQNSIPRRSKEIAALTPKSRKTIEYYTQLHSSYMSWSGTRESFEAKYDVSWTNLRKWYTNNGFETRPDRKSGDAIITSQKYEYLYSKYLNWSGSIEEFERRYNVKWTNMKKWFSKKGYQTRGR